MRSANFTPEAQHALDQLWDRNEALADRIEEGLDWIESDPPDVKAKRHRFVGGTYGFEVTYANETWIVVWAENHDAPAHPTVYYIGASFL